MPTPPFPTTYPPNSSNRCNRAGLNKEMASLDLEINSELDFLYIAEVDKAFQHVVHWLRNKNTTQYLENNPAACDTLVTAVQEVTRPKLPSTPAPTPSNPDTPSGQASPDTSPHIVQNRNSSLNHSNRVRQTSSRETDHQNPPATRPELEDGSQPYTPIDHAEVSEGERVTCDYQHSANFEILAQAEQGDESCDDEPSFVQPFSKTAPCRQQKRKHNFEDCVSDTISLDGVDVVDDELGNRSPDCLGHLECQATRIPSPSPETSSADVNGGGDRFMKLSASLRAKIHMIGNTATLASIEAYMKYIAAPPAFVDVCADAPTGDASLDTILASDQRLRALKSRIVRDEAVQESVKYLKIEVSISKRAALAELIGGYIEERDARRAMAEAEKGARKAMSKAERDARKAMSKRQKTELPRLSLNDYYTNLLFPETKQTEQQGKERTKARQIAKRKFSSWLTLGEPLAKMVQRFGDGILLRLPAKLTDKELSLLPRPQIQLFLDYIDSIHPGLKEQASKLPDVLSYRKDANPVLEKIILNLLPDLKSRETQKSLKLADGSDMAGPSINQTPTHSQLPYPHRQSQSPSESLSQTDHGSAQQPGHTEVPPNSEDYYSEEGDWRAEPQPSDDEGNVADIPYGVLDRLSSDEELIDWESYLMLSP